MTAAEFESTDRKTIGLLDRYAFAEAYHKAKVNSISDQEIEKQFTKEIPHPEFGKETEYKKAINENAANGAKWRICPINR